MASASSCSCWAPVRPFSSTSRSTSSGRAPQPILFSAPPPRFNSLRCPLLLHPPRSAVPEEGPLVKEAEEEEKKRLYVANLPFSYSASDIHTLFADCATVSDVEIIKHRDGRSKGYAFVTVDEADDVIRKFDSYELLDRIIRVEYAKSLKKPAPPPPPPTETKETRHLVYVSNLPWKVRSGNLREFFSASFKPASARVVFDSPSGRSAGYGFVSFLTEEEALAAISELDGKELMGRPLRLKMSEKKADKSSTKHESEGNVDHMVEQESEGNGEGTADAP